MQLLLNPDTPTFFLLEAGDSDATNMIWKFEKSNKPLLVVRHLRGKKMKTLDRLFDEFASALQFPYYFGENWAAFEDCINDLGWMDGTSFVLWISHPEQILNGEAKAESGKFLRVLAEAAKAWSTAVSETAEGSRSSVSFKILFQGEKPELDFFRSANGELLGDNGGTQVIEWKK